MIGFEKIKPKLLVAVDTYYPKKDGVLIFLEKVLPQLTEVYDITVISPRFAKKERRIAGCKIIRLETSKRFKIAGYRSASFSLKNRKKIAKEVKKSDIVWSQDLALIGALAIHYAKKYKKPSINYVHQLTWEQAVDVLKTNEKIKEVISRIIRIAVTHLYNKCDLIMIPYKDLEEDLNKKGVGTKKVVVQLGMDHDKFSPPENKEEAKRKIGISPEMKVIGYCGRLSKEKDLTTLRDAFKNAKKSFRKCSLLIVGSGYEKSLFKGMKDVKVTGYVSNTVPYYQAMDLFVMPSLTETTSLATLEAMSCKLTVIATRVGFINTYIRDRINGFFFPESNSYVLGKKIDILLRNSSIRKEVGEFARKTIIQRFSWDKTVSDIKKVIEELY